MPPLSKSFNVSMRLGQTISTQIDCMLFLRLGKGGGMVRLEANYLRSANPECWNIKRFLGGSPEHCLNNQRLCCLVM